MTNQKTLYAMTCAGYKGLDIASTERGAIRMARRSLDFNADLIVQARIATMNDLEWARSEEVLLPAGIEVIENQLKPVL